MVPFDRGLAKHDLLCRDAHGEFVRRWREKFDLAIDLQGLFRSGLVLGVGMGLVVSPLGNVVQSAIGDEQRSEAGGLPNTSQQLGPRSVRPCWGRS